MAAHEGSAGARFRTAAGSRPAKDRARELRAGLWLLAPWLSAPTSELERAPACPSAAISLRQCRVSCAARPSSAGSPTHRSGSPPKPVKMFTPLSPSPRLLGAQVSRRKMSYHRSLRGQRWAREFYRIRGEYAHGRLRTRGSISWNPESHLLCGALAFPLLVKNLLEREDIYNATTRNRAEVAAFARLIKDLSDPAARLRSWYGDIAEAESELAAR
jgi:hypothetical protein